MYDLQRNIEKIQKLEADKWTLFLEMFTVRFGELADQMRKIQAGQDKVADMNERLLKKNELAKKLQVSISTISKLQTEGLPSMPCGAAIRFDYLEVLQWLRGRRRKHGNEARCMVA